MTVYRVWATFSDQVWYPVSATFATRREALRWANKLNAIAFRIDYENGESSE
jgi:hypothetical protein